MKYFNYLPGLLIIAVFFYGNLSFAQDQKSSGNVPQYLMDQYNAAKDSYNGEEKQRVMKEIEKYLDVFELNTTDNDYKFTGNVNPPFIQDWYVNDILVHSGDVSNFSYRQIDLKQGEDGWMYLAVSRRNVSGNNGNIRVYRSSNGGAAWATVGTLSSTTNYFQSISMTVESRNNSIPDSTRIFVYFIACPSTNWNGSNLGMVSFRRNGTGVFSGTVHNPPSGYKFETVSVCSDGAYYTSSTYIHIIVREASNSGADNGMRHYLTTSWGASYTTANFNSSPLYNEINPSAQYADLNGNDQIWVAAERTHIINNYHSLRLFKIPEIPQNDVYTVSYITTTANVVYRRPALTIVQQRYNVPRKLAVTTTMNDNPRWFYSDNGASSWVRNIQLGPSTTCHAYFTSCCSDSMTTTGGAYLILGYASNDGDSVNVKTTTIPPVVYYSYFKRNSHICASQVAPTTAIHRVGNSKYPAFAYAGSGPVNVYYNAQNLVTGVQPYSEIPARFELSQNYPNPFNPVTDIRYDIPKTSHVKLVIYNTLGQEVTTLVNETLQPGSYKAVWNANNYASGVYFYRLVTHGFTDVKKMVLIK